MVSSKVVLTCRHCKRVRGSACSSMASRSSGMLRTGCITLMVWDMVLQQNYLSRNVEGCVAGLLYVRIDRTRQPSKGCSNSRQLHARTVHRYAYTVTPEHCPNTSKHIFARLCRITSTASSSPQQPHQASGPPSPYPATSSQPGTWHPSPRYC